MYELLTETKTRPYLKDVDERRLPSTRRAQVQARDLRLARVQREDAAGQTSRGNNLLGRAGARIAAWLTVATRPAEDAKG